MTEGPGKNSVAVRMLISSWLVYAKAAARLRAKLRNDFPPGESERAGEPVVVVVAVAVVPGPSHKTRLPDIVQRLPAPPKAADITHCATASALSLKGHI